MTAKARSGLFAIVNATTAGKNPSHNFEGPNRAGNAWAERSGFDPSVLFLDRYQSGRRKRLQALSTPCNWNPNQTDNDILAYQPHRKKTI